MINDKDVYELALRCGCHETQAEVLSHYRIRADAKIDQMKALEALLREPPEKPFQRGRCYSEGMRMRPNHGIYRDYRAAFRDLISCAYERTRTGKMVIPKVRDDSNSILHRLWGGAHREPQHADEFRVVANLDELESSGVAAGWYVVAFDYRGLLRCPEFQKLWQRSEQAIREKQARGERYAIAHERNAALEALSADEERALLSELAGFIQAQPSRDHPRVKEAFLDYLRTLEMYYERKPPVGTNGNQGTMWDDVHIEFNRFICYDLVNRVGACVFGKAQHNEASLLYALDPSVGLLCLNPYEDQRCQQPVAAALLVLTEDMRTGQDVLLVDGCMVGEIELDEAGRNVHSNLPTALTELFAESIFAVATERAIERVVFNVDCGLGNHDGRLFVQNVVSMSKPVLSMEYNQSQADSLHPYVGPVEETYRVNVPTGEPAVVERAARGAAFKIHLARQGFTHELRKKQLSPELVQRISREGYSGQMYFDSWYGTAKGTPEPFWNLGVGGVHGIEIAPKEYDPQGIRGDGLFRILSHHPKDLRGGS